MEILVNENNFLDQEKLPAEIVERKGIGHPDTISDAISEEYSVELSKFYIEKFGKILHHNVDKALLVAGKAFPVFGGGKVEEPINFYLVGRVITEYNGEKVPVEEIYQKTAREWLQKNIRNLDIEKDINLHLLVKPGSQDLVGLFDAADEVPLANDTSFGVGFYPLSKTEEAVLKIEQYLNSDEFKKIHPELGEDIKVMGVRRGDFVKITVAAAFVSKYLNSVDEYLDKKREIAEAVRKFASHILPYNFDVDINSADLVEQGIVYITVTGISGESGDDGQVGRGNRANGLITPYRPMSLEAVAGKNPVSHVGKIYNVFANEIAKRLVEGFEEVEDALIYMVSQIGKPITEPQIFEARVRTKKGNLTEGLKSAIKSKLDEYLGELPVFWKRFLNRELGIY